MSEDGASMTDAQKRKEPEPTASKEEDAKADAKRAKPNPPDPAVVKKQIEYYLSDENLKHDKFFHEKISSNSEGWLDLSLVLSCNKMKAMRATNEDVLKALKGSKIEVNEGGTAVRRPANVALPTLEARPTHVKKSSIHAHDGGVIAVLKGLPEKLEKQGWVEVKEKLRSKLPDKVSIWYVGEVNERKCTILCSPFDGDVTFFEELQLEVGGETTTCEVAQDTLLQTALKQLPKHLKEKREKEARKRQKERNRPIVIGSTRFAHVAALRGRVKEILNARSEGEQLKPGGSDFKLIQALLTYHPKGEEKSKGMTGIKVAKSSQGDSRCFYMIKEDGQEEDFSAKKCLDAVELNPPYVPLSSTKEEKKDSKDSASSQAAKPDESAKAEEPKAEKPAAASESAAPASAEAPAAEDKADAEPEKTGEEKEEKKDDAPAGSGAPESTEAAPS